jgi:hypothetical protein
MTRTKQDVTVGSKWVLDDGFDYSTKRAVVHESEGVAIEVIAVEEVTTSHVMRNGPEQYQVRIKGTLVTWRKLEGPEGFPAEGFADAEDLAECGRLVGWDTGESLGNGRFCPTIWFPLKADAERVLQENPGWVMVERPEPTAKSETWF